MNHVLVWPLVSAVDHGEIEDLSPWTRSRLLGSYMAPTLSQCFLNNQTLGEAQGNKQLPVTRAPQTNLKKRFSRGHAGSWGLA